LGNISLRSRLRVVFPLEEQPLTATTMAFRSGMLGDCENYSCSSTLRHMTCSTGMAWATDLWLI
jgi:hypothetical protein